MMSTTHLAYIGLGSNLQSPIQQVLSARDRLADWPGIEVRASSSLYRTAPVDCLPGQPDYINAVLEVATTLTPHELLHALFAVERQQGRERHFLNSPRTLDADLLIYGNVQMHTPELILPHPRAHQRAFVLEPLLEIAPHCHIPGLGAARNFSFECASQEIHRIATRPYAHKLDDLHRSRAA